MGELPRNEGRSVVHSSATSQNRYADYIAWLFAALYATIYSCLGILRYQTYHIGCDGGLFLQSISTAFHGFHNTAEGASHFAYHFSPILYLLAVPVWLSKSPIALILAQSLAGGLTIPPIYGIARRRLPATPSILVALVVSLYPALGGVSFTDFSENAFAPAAAAWLIWSIDRRSMFKAILFAVICLAIKEDQAIILSFLGIAGAVYFFQRKERRWAIFSLGLTIVSIAVFTSYLELIRPAAGVWYGYPAIRDFYGGLDPLPLFVGIFSLPKLLYVVALLLPILGICLISRCMVLAIPGLLECLVSRVPITYKIGPHYPAAWAPYVLAAFAIGTSIIWRRSPRNTYKLLGACVIVSICINVFFSPNDWYANFYPQSSTQHAAIEDFIRTLPAKASITAFCPVYAHLGMYPNATVYAQSPTSFIVIYPQRDVAGWDAEERHFIMSSRKYYAISDVNGLKFFKRK